jgi:tetratricopeptide (TPR) repeat protein
MPTNEDDAKGFLICIAGLILVAMLLGPTIEKSDGSSFYRAAKRHHDSGRHNLARVSYEKALVVYSKSLKENRLSMANTLNNLGTAYRDLNERNKAKDCYEQSLEI